MIATQQAIVLLDTLAQLPLFEGEQRVLLEALVPHCGIELLAPNTLLLSPRRPQDRAFVILQGQVEIRLGRRAEQAITTLGPGQCIGEMSVIEGVPPSAAVITVTACTVVAIEGGALRGLLENSQVLARNLLRMLARRLRKDNLIVRQSLEQQATSEQHARLDPLSGLFNRRWLDEVLPETLERHHADAKPLTLLMLDIDRFKAFNDTHGHLAGDLALIRVAGFLQAQIRSGDQAARFGGEEFLVILPETATATAHRIANRLRDTISRATLYDHTGEPLPNVTVSIGLAEGLPGESVESLIARADAALYQAKQAGRDRVVVSAPGFLISAPGDIPSLQRMPSQS